MPWGALLSAFVAFIEALFGGKAKDPEVVEAKKNEEQSRKEEAVFAAPDRDRAAVDSILLGHADE